MFVQFINMKENAENTNFIIMMFQTSEKSAISFSYLGQTIGVENLPIRNIKIDRFPVAASIFLVFFLQK